MSARRGWLTWWTSVDYLIAHPDIGMVLRKTDLAELPHVGAALSKSRGETAIEVPIMSRDRSGREVLTAFAPIGSLGWVVFVDVPRSEALQPVYDALLRTGIVLALGLLVAAATALWLAQRMVVPIRALAAGAARVGGGDLDHRIEINSDDELESVGRSIQQHGRASSRIPTPRLSERSRSARISSKSANLAKSRFLAAASHDLRQPLHALNLFVAQLRTEQDQAERSRLVAAHRCRRRRDERAVQRAAGHFQARRRRARAQHLGVPGRSPAQADRDHVRGGRARKGAASAGRPEQTPGSAATSSCSSASCSTSSPTPCATPTGAESSSAAGAAADRLRIDVCDSGIGIPEDQQRNIFGEFYRLAGPDGDRRGGLGLGLAIVDRLCRLLDHPIELTLARRHGARASPSRCPWPRRSARTPEHLPHCLRQPIRRSGKLVDGDRRRCRWCSTACAGLLQSWGCQVVTADIGEAALARLAQRKADGPI